MMDVETKIQKVMRAIEDELRRALIKHAEPFPDIDNAWQIIDQQMEELRAVDEDDTDGQRKYSVRTAAMGARTLLDLNLID